MDSSRSNSHRFSGWIIESLYYMLKECKIKFRSNKWAFLQSNTLMIV